MLQNPVETLPHAKETLDALAGKYRIHGTNQPESIGKAMSSGCIRMLNQDIAELFDQVIVGTPVTVRPSQGT
jgi:lipoprotein-anchoring transpeptidase ErfK/SrfK